MAKRIHKVALSRSEKGQISIFFSASLVVMISIVAFVINIGLFVKAKINLQNATDAAAYAGAAVQARQLSKIAYLNWEMRNIYKEWMYKYYVVGNLNLPDVEGGAGTSPGDVMQFKFQNDVNVLTGDETSDKFNIPTVCIHIAGSKTNICKRYSIPGLPEFGATNLPGAEEASRVFLDTLIATKVNDCVDRTRLNMSVATTWAYNVLGNSMDDSLAGRGPAILSDRQGAWPRAVELAIRMRNLEFVVNRPPVTDGVCNEPGAGGALTRCSKSITEIEGEKRLGNERFIKAFYSGYRNLGNESDTEMKGTFTLSEIPPAPYTITVPEDNSLLLSPDKQEAKTKYFLDLKLMLVNYAVFYAAMIPRADTATSGACDVSKVAIPVPGYPLGFYKNPEVLTYYAVKGEAEFRGMFNPFAENDGLVKMVAYSAAKPFGGRIGPMLFTQRGTDTFLTSRGDPLKRRSMPYMTSYDFEGVQIRNFIYKASPSAPNEADYIPGLPLPTSAPFGTLTSFWLSDADSPVGGKVTSVGSVQFGVPNLVYDYTSPFSIDGYSNLADKINQIKATDASTEKEIGLFSKAQFSMFKGSLSSGTITPDQLDIEIARVRAPTSYEAANYLIPTPNDFNVNNGYDSFGFINTQEPTEIRGTMTRYRASIYAPLHGGNGQNDILYQNATEVLIAITEFMRVQESGMEKYKRSLNRAAVTIFNQRARVAPGAEGSKPGYKRAAEGVSNIPIIKNASATTNTVSSTSADSEVPDSCESIAGQFLYFFNDKVNEPLSPDNNTGCPVSLYSLLEQYFAGGTASGSFYDPYYYQFDLSWPTAQISNDSDAKKFMSAYMPGSFTGVGQDGQYVNPIDSGITDKMRRNTYSTKFITLDSVRGRAGQGYADNSFATYAEGAPNESTDETRLNNFRNPLNPTAVDAEIDPIKY